MRKFDTAKKRSRFITFQVEQIWHSLRVLMCNENPNRKHTALAVIINL